MGYSQAVQSNINERQIFDQAQISLASAFQDVPGFDVRNYKLTQSYLRAEVALVTGQSQYRFNILVNQSQPQPFNTEVRLNLQDAFVTSAVGFFIAAPTGPTDATFLPATYPDSQVFTTTTARDAQTLYNGSLRITVNNNVLVTAWDTYRHFYVPQTQGDSTATPPVRDEQNGMDGFFPMEPNIVLVGSKNNQIVLELPAGLTTVLANSRAILWLRGILAQNSTVVS